MIYTRVLKKAHLAGHMRIGEEDMNKLLNIDEEKYPLDKENLPMIAWCVATEDDEDDGSKYIETARLKARGHGWIVPAKVLAKVRDHANVGQSVEFTLEKDYPWAEDYTLEEDSPWDEVIIVTVLSHKDSEGAKEVEDNEGAKEVEAVVEKAAGKGKGAKEVDDNEGAEEAIVEKAAGKGKGKKEKAASIKRRLSPRKVEASPRKVEASPRKVAPGKAAKSAPVFFTMPAAKPAAKPAPVFFTMPAAKPAAAAPGAAKAKRAAKPAADSERVAVPNSPDKSPPKAKKPEKRSAELPAESQEAKSQKIQASGAGTVQQTDYVRLLQTIGRDGVDKDLALAYPSRWTLQPHGTRVVLLQELERADDSAAVDVVMTSFLRSTSS